MTPPDPQQVAEIAGRTCETCQGNGELVTDWERYLYAHPGDQGDEGTAVCPDCDGIGTINIQGNPHD